LSIRTACGFFPLLPADSSVRSSDTDLPSPDSRGLCDFLIQSAMNESYKIYIHRGEI
jgi:hypothetical protein